MLLYFIIVIYLEICRTVKQFIIIIIIIIIVIIILTEDKDRSTEYIGVSSSWI